MDAVTALEKCGGAARRPQLRMLGVGDSALRTALTHGRIVRLRRGGYAVPHAPAPLVGAIELGGVVSHASAASLHGFDLWQPPSTLEVTVPRNTHRTSTSARIHRANLAPRDREPCRAVTSVDRTLIDCARTMPLLDAVVLLDSAVRGRFCTMAFLLDAAATATGPGSAALRRAAAHVDELAGSPLESALRLLLGLLGAQVRTQVSIPAVGTVDFVLDRWLVIEADGFEFHCNRAAYRNDRRRANALAARGQTLLRFTWEDIRLRPIWVLAQVEAVLRLGPSRAAGLCAAQDHNRNLRGAANA
ncbi:MAG: DUF559 domain-containing protein [Sporichthyaceae bacterium]